MNKAAERAFQYDIDCFVLKRWSSGRVIDCFIASVIGFFNTTVVVPGFSPTITSLLRRLCEVAG